MSNIMTLTLCLSIGRRLPPTHPFVVSMGATPEEGRVLYATLASSFLHLRGRTHLSSLPLYIGIQGQRL